MFQMLSIFSVSTVNLIVPNTWASGWLACYSIWYLQHTLNKLHCTLSDNDLDSIIFSSLSFTSNYIRMFQRIRNQWIADVSSSTCTCTVCNLHASTHGSLGLQVRIEHTIQCRIVTPPNVPLHFVTFSYTNWWLRVQVVGLVCNMFCSVHICTFNGCLYCTDKL